MVYINAMVYRSGVLLEVICSPEQYQIISYDSGDHFLQDCLKILCSITAGQLNTMRPPILPT
jgi:hypothetical protein